MEKQMGVTEARSEFKTIVDQVQHRGDTYIINRHGKAAAAVVPIDLYKTWQKQREALFEAIHQAQQQANLEPEAADRIAGAAMAAARAKAAGRE